MKTRVLILLSLLALLGGCRTVVLDQPTPQGKVPPAQTPAAAPPAQTGNPGQ